MGAVNIGVDIGQRQDPTAIAVVEVQEADGQAHHFVRYLERLPLGTPYPQVAARVIEVADGAADRAGSDPLIYVDATGVGGPVVDLLRGARYAVVPVCFNHGDRRVRGHGEVRLGKAWLVSRLQVLLQQGRLHLPRSSEAEVLARELMDYEIRVDQNGSDKYGAFKVGTHDDLVTALGLAVQEDRSVGEVRVFVIRRKLRTYDVRQSWKVATRWGDRSSIPPWERD